MDTTRKVAAHAYAALCTAAWRSVDARHAAARRRVPSDAALIEHGQALAVLADRRIAHWQARHPGRLEEIDRNGLRIAHADPNAPGSIATAIPAEHPVRRTA